MADEIANTGGQPAVTPAESVETQQIASGQTDAVVADETQGTTEITVAEIDDAAEEVSRVEQLRREQKSLLDKNYNLEQRLKAVETQQAPVQPAQTTADPFNGDAILAEMYKEGYLTKLNDLVQSGMVSEEDAKLRVEEQYGTRKAQQETRKMLDNISQHVTGFRSHNVSGVLGEALAGEGIKAGSDLEKLAVQILKDDFDVDYSNPVNLADADPKAIKNFAHYAALEARHRAAALTTAPKKTAVPQTASPVSVSATGNGGIPDFESIEEAAAYIRAGRG